MVTTTAEFLSFDRVSSGRMVTSSKRLGIVVAYARNPYGSHNLVLMIYADDGCWAEAWRYGDYAVLAELVNMGPGAERVYRRVRRFLARKGKAVHAYRLA